MKLQKIYTGGQTGVDRAAFDAALALGLAIGGWVPKGRLAEDGQIPDRYIGMQETAEGDVSVRTRLNVRDADATLIVFSGELRGGTLLTLQAAKELGKPYFLKDYAAGEDVRDVLQWLWVMKPAILNIAGPRESENPGVYAATLSLMKRMIEGLESDHEQRPS